jgi:phospholipid transport system substrate-binding protein
MKSFLKVILLFTILYSNCLIAGEASNIINKASNNVIKRIVSLQEKTDEAVMQVIDEELMQHVDYKYASLKTLGKHYRKASKNKTELRLYMSVFRRTLLKDYTNIFKKYTNEKITIVKESTTGKTTSVYGNIVSIDNKVRIVFKMKKSKKTGKVKLYDIVAEGISLIDSKRSEYSSIIKKSGFSELVKILERKSK